MIRHETANPYISMLLTKHGVNHFPRGSQPSARFIIFISVKAQILEIGYYYVIKGQSSTKINSFIELGTCIILRVFFITPYLRHLGDETSFKQASCNNLEGPIYFLFKTRMGLILRIFFSCCAEWYQCVYVLLSASCIFLISVYEHFLRPYQILLYGGWSYNYHYSVQFKFQLKIRLSVKSVILFRACCRRSSIYKSYHVNL